MQHTLILALFLAFAPLAAAQESAPAAAPAAPALRSARFVWTGTTLGPKGERIGRPPVIAETKTTFGAGSKPVVQRANPRATADAHLKELASIRLSIEVDRELDDAQEALDDLCVRAAWKEDYAGRFDVLQEVAIARSELLEKRGKKEAALAAIAQLLPDAALRDAFASKYELEPASAAQLAAETRALAAPAVADAATRLRPGGAAQGGTAKAGDDQESSIEASVRAWLSKSDFPAILELGTRALPTLEKAVREAPGAMNPNGNADALTLHFQLDEARGASFALAQRDTGGFLWKKRIVRAMTTAKVLVNPGSWMVGADPYQRPVLTDTVWVPLVEGLATDADVGNEAVTSLVRVFALQDALTSKMQEVLTRAVLEGSPQERQAAFAALEGCVNRPTVLRVIERVIESKDASCRRFAAQFLVEETRSPALLARANDEDPEVRRFVLRSLSQRQVRVAVFSASASATYTNRTCTPELGASERGALATLVGDPDAGVRAEAVTIALRLSPPLPVEVYERIAADESVDLRVLLATGIDCEHPAAPRVIERLAADREPLVLAAVDRWFGSASSAFPLDAFEAPYLVRLEATTTPTLGPNGEPSLWRPLSVALLRPTALPLVLGVAARDTGRWLVPVVVEKYPWPERNLTAPPLVTSLAVAPDDAFEALLRALPRENPSSVATFNGGALRAATQGVCQRKAWESILSDANVDRGLRLWAACVLGVTADPRTEEAVRKLLQEDSWKTTPLQDGERHPLASLAKTFRAERRAEFLRGLIQDARTDDLALRWIVGNAPKEGIATEVLERWLGTTLGDAWASLIAESIPKLPASDDPKTVALLRRALHDPYGDVSTAYALGRMKTTAGLELVAEALDAGWIADREERARVQIGAASSATAYMSEAAAQKLLAGVTLAVTADARKACLDGVEQIRTFLDEKQRWDLRDSELEQRAQAVKELLVLLADPDALTRAQAAKSLATLNAVEHLPKLIALLKDKSAEVRAAAQQAIDQLHAKSAKKE